MVISVLFGLRYSKLRAAKAYLDPSDGHWKYLLDYWVLKGQYKKRDALLFPSQANAID